MKQLSLTLLADKVLKQRKAHKLSQAKLAELTGINRALISRLETNDFAPSVDQLLLLSQVLDFDISDVLVDDNNICTNKTNGTDTAKQYNIAVAGTGYVGLSLAVLLAQHNKKEQRTSGPLLLKAL